MENISDPTQWLLETGRECRDSDTLVDKLAGLFIALGIEPARINIVQGALHPEVVIKLYVWRGKSGNKYETSTTAEIYETSEQILEYGVVKEISLGNSTFQNPAFTISPLYTIMTTELNQIHEHLPPSRKEFTYPILEEFQAAGATGYVALPVLFSCGARGCMSCTTNKEDGFTDQDIEKMQRILQPLSYILELHASQRLSKTLLNTYLGRRPGESVLSGKIKRGDVTTLNAAIWFSDLRGFTEIADQLNSSDLIKLLNDYFEVIGASIKDNDGEILKFIGDAVLAIFPTSEETQSEQACINAFKAARHASEKLKALHKCLCQSYNVDVQHGISLHFGEVQYGNIGSVERLDFTVIGHAVNITSRIEGLCPLLNTDLLLSSDFHKYVASNQVLENNETFSSCGSHLLKGMQREKEVFQVIPKT